MTIWQTLTFGSKIAEKDLMIRWTEAKLIEKTIGQQQSNDEKRRKIKKQIICKVT